MAVRVIQAGMGGWGVNWAENVVPKVSNVKTVAYVDMAAASLERAQAKLGLSSKCYFKSLSEALSAVECDAVLITSQLEGHIPLSLEALAAGRHVLVEKPFAASIEDAQKAVIEAERQDRVLMVSQNYRFQPAPIAVRKIIERSDLGAVGTVHIDFRRYANHAPIEGHKHYGIWHPLLVDMSIHHFDLMRMVLGVEPLRIECRTWNPSWSRFKSASSGSAIIDFENNITVDYRGSWVSTDTQTSWSGDWRIECEKGVVEWCSRGDAGVPERVTVRRLGKEPKEIKLPKVARRDREGCLAAFAKAVEKGLAVDTSGRDNINTLALMFGAVKAADTGVPVFLRAPELAEIASGNGGQAGMAVSAGSNR